MKRAAVQWGIVGICITLRKVLRRYPVIRNKDGTGQTDDGTGFLLAPLHRCRRIRYASISNQPSPEKYQPEILSVDCEQTLKDPSDYAATETDKKLIERYQHDWQLLAGHDDAQTKMRLQVMNIK